MSHAFLIVVSVAITLKLLFLSFSLYVTLNNQEPQTQKDLKTKNDKTCMALKWKQVSQVFLSKTTRNKNNTNFKLNSFI
ncbi:unnamed protein product [Parnassius apollo]|uniref:(apollo) hypothetical protein n=1 Tax=Parnassius apollo TaxID=110799 RepID=A0A8S3YGS3_PARAO|nr:unnamed protein product [Parnassius apollo]